MDTSSAAPAPNTPRVIGTIDAHKVGDADTWSQLLQDVEEFEAGQPVVVNVNKVNVDNGLVTIEAVPNSIAISASLWGFFHETYNYPLNQKRIEVPVVGPALLTAGQDTVTAQKTT